MHFLAPAKINLHLRVGSPRADGFHPLLTWMTTVGLFDRITFSPAPAGSISLTCNDRSIPTDDRNLVIKAGKLLRRSDAHSVSIHLEKNIPHGGGLGGGSSDAAFTLKALNQFWQLNQTKDQLCDYAARLGSDIPFFLYGPSSICRGRGEIVQPIPSPKLARWVVLILPAMSMPTPAVYRQFDKMIAEQTISDHNPVETDVDWNHWAALPSQELLPLLVNDLEAPAFAIAPKLDQLRKDIEQLLQRPTRMSGSGSSLFTLYDDPSEASHAAAMLVEKLTLKAMAIELAKQQTG